MCRTVPQHVFYQHFLCMMETRETRSKDKEDKEYKEDIERGEASFTLTFFCLSPVQVSVI